MKSQTKTLLLACFCCFIFVVSTFAQPKKEKEIAAIGYYAGNSQDIDQYQVDKLTHIIFSSLRVSRRHVGDSEGEGLCKKEV